MNKLASPNLKKHAAAIHCSGELSLVERKLSNILLLNSYEELLFKDVHTIPTKHLFAMLGWEDSNNVVGLKSTLKGLMSTVIEFNLMGDGGEVWEAMTLLSSAKIADGYCRYSYAKDLAAKFYKPEIFAVINLSVQKQFKSNYALTLYENCVRFIKVGSTGWWSLDTFRKVMGANSETYHEFKRLSSFVIKKAMDEINQVSDIRLEVEYKKESRKVVALRFLITASSQQVLIDREAKANNTDDVLEELKGNELFKRLREHGIGERLALSWMIEEPELAAKAVDYTESMDAKGNIKGNTAGYIRRLIESKAELEEPLYKTNKQKLEREESVRRKVESDNKKQLEAFRKLKFKEVSQNLSFNDLIELKDQFLMSIEAVSLTQTNFDRDKGKFVDKVTQLTFMPWLKKKVTPEFDQREFDLWLQKKV